MATGGPSPSILTNFATLSRGDVAAERVGYDRHLLLPERVDQLREVVDEGVHRVVAFGRPFAVAVAAQVGADDVPVAAQFLGHPVPAAAMIAPAVLEDQQGRLRVAPVDVVQAQALRDEAVRSRAEQ
jgi:hypothetical protein